MNGLDYLFSSRLFSITLLHAHLWHLELLRLSENRLPKTDLSDDRRLRARSRSFSTSKHNQTQLAHLIVAVLRDLQRPPVLLHRPSNYQRREPYRRERLKKTTQRLLCSKPLTRVMAL